jgi:outer membrane protein
MKKYFILAILVSALTTSVHAQDNQPAKPAGTTLTFKEAIQLALRNNVALNSARNNLYASRAQKASGIANLGPQIGISANAYQSNGNRFIQQEGKVVNATVNGMNASLDVNQPILNGFSGINYMKSTSESYDAQLYLVNRTQEDVISYVASQYLQVLLDKELVKIAKENVEAQRAQYEQVKAQVELGARSPVDEYNQQALLSNAEMRVAQAENTLVISKTTLFQTLVVDPTTITTLEDPAWDINAVGMDIGDLNALIAQAQEKRSDLKSARSSQESFKHGWRANKGFLYPSLNAFYSNGSAYNQLKGANKNDPAFRSFEDQFLTDNRSNSFGLSLYIPIINGLNSRYRAIQNKALYENSKFSTSAREVQVKTDVMRTYENFANVKSAYIAGGTGLEASKMAFNLETERYNLGITSFVDLANANKTYVQAQTDLASAKFRLLFQKILLDYAIGDLTLEDIP